jgi:polyisoprenoid-binding protein YceI
LIIGIVNNILHSPVLTKERIVTTTARTYRIDRSHSEAVFQVRHLISKVRGRFADFEGTLTFDDANPDLSSVAFTINASSLDTADTDRDKHLRSADFFDVERFGTISFRSARVVKKSDVLFDVTGDLTIRDVTKTITISVTYLGKAKDPWGNERVAFEAEYTLNRKEFGLNWNAALEGGGFLVGDEVKTSLSVQAVPQ